MGLTHHGLRCTRVRVRCGKTRPAVYPCETLEGSEAVEPVWCCLVVSIDRWFGFVLFPSSFHSSLPASRMTEHLQSLPIESGHLHNGKSPAITIVVPLLAWLSYLLVFLKQHIHDIGITVVMWIDGWLIMSTLAQLAGMVVITTHNSVLLAPLCQEF